MRGDLCCYCGEPATTEDHFPPKTNTKHGFLFPCCKECNVIAGERYPRNLEARIALVKAAIERKAAKYLAIPDWTKEDLKDIAPNMRRVIKNGMAQKLRAQERLDFNSLGYLASIDKGNAFSRHMETGLFDDEEE